ncbi:hypothetical protein KGF57_001221 [Candida theae]|uniref:BSD domain-containing protein n=1 Tax=Candida theae TaxID=1198502 RepID=A0AAD5BHH8_9ASCO|nr:uncharacterized protein KGF57_001221 [Candida theae]KAI5963846.1 hypothetical protein KGF57_001221 [Candida theae]
MDPIDTVYVQEEDIFSEDVSKSKLEVEKSNKTEETFENLEQEIDKAYGAVESKFQQLWKENAGVLQDKYHLEEHKQSLINQLNVLRANVGENKNVQSVGESLREFQEQLKQSNLEQRLHLNELRKAASSALDGLDSRLEAVENKASEYVTNFTSFLSNIVSVKPEPKSEEKEVLYSSPLYTQYGATRYDNDLLKLHTTKEFYTDDTIDNEEEISNFNSDSKTSEIEALLKKYPETLEETMNELVPVKVSYNTFWYRYFKNEGKLKDLDKQRKELLQKEKKGETAEKARDKDEDDFTWDDEDEEAPVKVSKPKQSQPHTKVSEEDTNKDKGDAYGDEDEDEDEDEDDWE